MNFKFFRFVELAALLPVLAISLACLYKYSFYNSLNVPWVLSQLQISGILMNAVPIFLEMFLGLSVAAAVYLYFRSIFDEGCSLFIVIIGLFILIVSLKIFSWDTQLVTLLLDNSIFLYIYLLVGFILYTLETTSIMKSLCVGICMFSLVLFQALIDYKSYKEIEKLFNNESPFSRVYFTKEGNELIPTTYISNADKKEYLLDWRLLELVGDKAIIIISNKIELDGRKKPQIRIIDYKLIDRLY